MMNGVEQSQPLVKLCLDDGIPVNEVSKCLQYLRQRVGVPRDMSVHAAKQLRSHINWFLDSVNAK